VVFLIRYSPFNVWPIASIVTEPNPPRATRSSSLLLYRENVAPNDSSTVNQNDRLPSMIVRVDDSDNSSVDAILAAHSSLDRA